MTFVEEVAGHLPEHDDMALLREALEALRDRVEHPTDRFCCPDCEEDGKAVDLITKLEERLLAE